MDDAGQLTSGVPFGRRNSSGTILFKRVFPSCDGGVGLALYSVRAKLLKDGVLASGISLRDGVRTSEVPFGLVIAEASSSELRARHGSAISEGAMFPRTKLT